MKFCVSKTFRRFTRPTIPAVLLVVLTIPLLMIGTPTHAHLTGQWIEVGKCEIDYTEDWPEWLRTIVDYWSRLFPQLDIAHEDAYVTTYTDSNREHEILTTHRGFFATFDDKANWVWSMLQYANNKRIIYVDSEMRENESRDSCTESFFYNEDFWELTSHSIYYGAHLRFEESWAPNYHLFERNCQHWADYVVSGTDSSSTGAN